MRDYNLENGVIADARYLRTFFSEILDEDKFKECEGVIKLEIKNESAD